MRLIIITLCLLFSRSLPAQVTFIIDTMTIGNIYNRVFIEYDDRVELDGREREGPTIGIDFTIRNNCDSTIQLTPIDSKMWLTFNYNNRRYVEHIYTLGLWDNKVIEIPSNNEYHYSAFAHLFLGTSIQKKSGDYLLELIEVLPTLKIHYGDKNHILVSSEIKNVRVVKKGK